MRILLHLSFGLLLMAPADALSSARAEAPSPSPELLMKCGLAAQQPQTALKACNDLIKTLKTRPQDEKTRKALPLALMSRANAYARLGKLDQALADINRAIELDPKLHTAYVFRSGIWLAKANIDKAVADLSKAIALKPDELQFYIARGGLLLKKGDHKKALADFDRALEISPGNLSAHFSRGLAYDQARAFDKARAEYEKALAATPATPQERLMQKVARQRLAALKARKTGSPQANSRQDGKAAPQAPSGAENASAIALKGALLLHSGKAREAIDLFDKALALNPPPNIAFAAYGYRGMAWSRLGKYDKAVADFTEALKIKPDDAATLANRGNAWIGMGNHEKARADFEKVLSMPARTEADKEAHAMARQALKKLGKRP